MEEIDKTIRECPVCREKFVLSTDELFILQEIWNKMPLSRSWLNDYLTFCDKCMEKGRPGNISPSRIVREHIDRDPSAKKYLKDAGIKTLKQFDVLCSKVKKSIDKI